MDPSDAPDWRNTPIDGQRVMNDPWMHTVPGRRSMSEVCRAIQFESLLRAFDDFRRHFEARYGPLTAADPYLEADPPFDLKQMRAIYMPPDDMRDLVRDAFAFFGYPVTVLREPGERRHVLGMLRFLKTLLRREEDPTPDTVRRFDGSRPTLGDVLDAFTRTS